MFFFGDTKPETQLQVGDVTQSGGTQAGLRGDTLTMRRVSILWEKTRAEANPSYQPRPTPSHTTNIHELNLDLGGTQRCTRRA